jgi:hypothetical protein
VSEKSRVSVTKNWTPTWGLFFKVITKPKNSVIFSSVPSEKDGMILKIFIYAATTRKNV